MRAIIICGGSVGKYIFDYIKDDDYIICADSGYDHVKALGIKPDIIIGDMDSAENMPEQETVILYPPEKDFTDSELAINFAIEKGYKTLLMFGMIGSRVDHSYSNLSLLFRLRGYEAYIIDSNNVISMLFDTITINGEVGDIISILPFSGDIKGVTTSGLKYKLDNDVIKIGTSLGVSNEMAENACTISIKEGTALIIRSND